MPADFEEESGTLGQVTVRPRTSSKVANKTKLLPPYAVVLHNDDFNTVDFVIEVIVKVFKYPVEKAFALTLEAHETGRSIVWSGSLELAELKAEQIRSCGADPEAKARGALPLKVTIEAQ